MEENRVPWQMPEGTYEAHQRAMIPVKSYQEKSEMPSSHPSEKLTYPLIFSGTSVIPGNLDFSEEDARKIEESIAEIYSKIRNYFRRAWISVLKARRDQIKENWPDSSERRLESLLVPDEDAQKERRMLDAARFVGS